MSSNITDQSFPTPNDKGLKRQRPTNYQDERFPTPPILGQTRLPENGQMSHSSTDPVYLTSTPIRISPEPNGDARGGNSHQNCSREDDQTLPTQKEQNVVNIEIVREVNKARAKEKAGLETRRAKLENERESLQNAILKAASLPEDPFLNQILLQKEANLARKLNANNRVIALLEDNQEDLNESVGTSTEAGLPRPVAATGTGLPRNFNDNGSEGDKIQNSSQVNSTSLATENKKALENENLTTNPNDLRVAGCLEPLSIPAPIFHPSGSLTHTVDRDTTPDPDHFFPLAANTGSSSTLARSSSSNNDYLAYIKNEKNHSENYKEKNNKISTSTSVIIPSRSMDLKCFTKYACMCCKGLYFCIHTVCLLVGFLVLILLFLNKHIKYTGPDLPLY